MLRTLISFGVLVSIAALVVWNVRGLETRAPLTEATPANAPRYTAKNAEWIHLDAQGAAQFRMTAVRVDYYDDRSARFDDVVVDRFVAGASPWRLTSPQARIPAQEERVQLLEPVVAEGTVGNSLPVRITTPELWVDAQRNELYTDAAVEMTSPQWQARGKGLRADLAGEKLALLHNTQVTYVPQP